MDEETPNIEDGPSSKIAAEEDIIEKVNANLAKIQKSERQIFDLAAIPDNNYEQYLDMFTPEVIVKIIDKFKTYTIKYQIGGTYYCNEADYMEYRCDAHFGFYNVKADVEQKN